MKPLAAGLVATGYALRCALGSFAQVPEPRSSPGYDVKVEFSRHVRQIRTGPQLKQLEELFLEPVKDAALSIQETGESHLLITFHEDTWVSLVGGRPGPAGTSWELIYTTTGKDRGEAKPKEYRGEFTAGKTPPLGVSEDGAVYITPRSDVAPFQHVVHDILSKIELDPPFGTSTPANTLKGFLRAANTGDYKRARALSLAGGRPNMHEPQVLDSITNKRTVLRINVGRQGAATTTKPAAQPGDGTTLVHFTLTYREGPEKAYVAAIVQDGSTWRVRSIEAQEADLGPDEYEDLRPSDGLDFSVLFGDLVFQVGPGGSRILARATVTELTCGGKKIEVIGSEIQDNYVFVSTKDFGRIKLEPFGNSVLRPPQVYVMLTPKQKKAIRTWVGAK